MKALYLLTILLFTVFTRVYGDDTFRAAVRIEKEDQGIQLIQMRPKAQIPTITPKKEVQDTLKKMKDGEEAVVEGRVVYQFLPGDTTRTMRPFLIIDALHPVSLRKLGEAGFIVAPDIVPQMGPEPYTQPTIAVTSDVSSAMILTGTLMLMEELTASELNPEVHKANQALILSAGTMATLLFIYEQVTGKTKL